MTAAHVKELFAMMLIGEGVVGGLYPERYTRMWATGPRPWRAFIGRWTERHELLRLVYAAEAAAGLWLATRQFAPTGTTSRRFAPDRTTTAVPRPSASVRVLPRSR